MRCAWAFSLVVWDESKGKKIRETTRAPTIKMIGRTPTLGLCSRNAGPQKGLVRRAHVDQHGCPSKNQKQASLEGSFRWTPVARCAQ